MRKTMKINGMYFDMVEPDALVGGCIAVYENAWPEPKETIEELEKLCSDPNNEINWDRAGTFGHGAFQDYRTNKQLKLSYFAELTGDPMLQTMNNILYGTLLKYGHSYASKFNIREQLFHEPYNVLKYTENTEYKQHYDGGTGIGRCFSAVLYLNNDYEGGEIEFINFNVKIKPEPGMLVIFPSNFAYEHIAHPVKSGTKYAFVTWINDRHMGN